MVKKLISITMGVGMVLATVSPIFAATGCANSITGATSINLCNTTLSKLKTLLLTNNGTVTHNVTKNAISGYNSANNNTASGGSWTINAGDATTDITSVGSLNTGSLTVAQTDPGMEQVGSNDTTGSSSNNTVNVSNGKTVNLTVDNTGLISHTVDANAHSGFNIANDNTITGGIQTGTASSISTVQSIMNDLLLNVTQ